MSLSTMSLSAMSLSSTKLVTSSFRSIQPCLLFSTSATSLNSTISGSNGKVSNYWTRFQLLKKEREEKLLNKNKNSKVDSKVGKIVDNNVASTVASAEVKVETQQSNIIDNNDLENVTIIDNDIKLTQRIAIAKSSNIKGSVKKMKELLHRIRNIPVDEAILQMRFHMKFRRCTVIGNVLRAAKTSAINTYGMDPKRLYVFEAFTNRDKALKRIKFHARGKMGLLQHRFCNLVVKVKEWTPEEFEKHQGRNGDKTAASIEKSKSRMIAKKLWIQGWKDVGLAAREKKNDERKMFILKRSEARLASSVVKSQL